MQVKINDVKCSAGIKKAVKYNAGKKMMLSSMQV